MSQDNWLDYAKKVQAIAQAGLTFTENDYDIDRYSQLRELSFKMLHQISGEKIEKINGLFEKETGYPTPKVDVRGVIIKDNKILLVQEKIDNNWSIPGGWADVGYSPKEIAEKEVFEESGMKVRAKNLMAVIDKKKHNYPEDLFHVYKLFIKCEIVEETLNPGMECKDAAFFELEKLPTLSLPRINESQIKMLFDIWDMNFVVCD